jgi:hypothetical protein
MTLRALRRRAQRGDTALQRSIADLCAAFGLARSLPVRKWSSPYMGSIGCSGPPATSTRASRSAESSRRSR